MNKVIIIIILLISSAVGLYAYSQLDKREETLTHAQKSASPEHLSATDFNSAITSGEYQLIDIRTEEEFIDGHITGAVQNDYYQTEEFKKYLDSLDKQKGYLIYCRSAKRSGAALDMMKQMGFTNVKDLEGGYNAWISQNLPIEK